MNVIVPKCAKVAVVMIAIAEKRQKSNVYKIILGNIRKTFL